MDSPGLDFPKQLAGNLVGGLAALTSIKQGGLANYLLARQRALADPNFRATLAGSPFAAGEFFVSGQRGPVAPPGQPMPAAGSVATPEEAQPGFVGPIAPPGQPGAAVAAPTANAFNVPGYEPGTARAWQPNLPPYAPEEALKEQARVSMIQGAGSPDAAVRAQAKAAAGIIPSQSETDALISRGVQLRAQGGIGTTVKLPIPGAETVVGSPYTAIGGEEYSTFDQAATAANAKGPGWHPVPSGRGTWLLQGPVGSTKPEAPAVAPPGGAPPVQPAAPATTPPGRPAGQGKPITAQPAYVPPSQPREKAPPPPPRPARPAPQTGTPLLGAGEKPLVIPQLPEAPPYQPPGAYVPGDVATTPRGGGARGYPSPAPPPEEELSAPRGGGGILGRISGVFAPAEAAAAEVPPAVAPPAPARVAPPPFTAWGMRPPPTPTEAAPAPPAPTEAAPSPLPVPTYQPPGRVTIVAPAEEPQPPPPGTPGTAVAPGIPPGAAPPPLSRTTRTGTEGQQDVYEFGPLSELAADAKKAGVTDFRTATEDQIAKFNQYRLARQQQEQVSTADIGRTMRGLTERERAQSDMLERARQDLNQFYREYPTPEDRDKYIGWGNRPWREVWEYVKEDPQFTAFFDQLANFRDFSADAKKLLDPESGASARGTVPTGYERGPQQFEKRLADFNFNLSRDIALMAAKQTMPAGALTQEWYNLMDSYFDRFRQEYDAAREPAPAREQPPTIQLAPPTTTTTQPPPQVNVLSDQRAP